MMSQDGLHLYGDYGINLRSVSSCKCCMPQPPMLAVATNSTSVNSHIAVITMYWAVYTCLCIVREN